MFGKYNTLRYVRVYDLVTYPTRGTRDRRTKETRAGHKVDIVNATRVIATIELF